MDEACGGDEELRREVEKLLGGDDSFSDLLLEQSQALDPTPTAWTSAQGLKAPGQEGSVIPSEIGPFRVIKLLGEGGMGAVYLAEQDEPVHRQLAVKVIRGAKFTSPDALGRFLAEREALARLSHPNIAQLYQAGMTPEGNPYFAMEYCAGTALNEYCDQNRLTIEDRLSLFITACEAVQHAHRRGIIHRDLKPSNILVTEVDGRPIVKVIDFGIAKAVDKPLAEALDLTGERLIGTPAFMSPEALRLVPNVDDIDTRTDVYSLGVVLYELLTGMRPFDFAGMNMMQFLATMAGKEAPRPSERLSTSDEATLARIAGERRLDPRTLRHRLEGDLVWITGMAIAKDRDRRYGSPAELAADLRRHLEHRPVDASPPSVRYRVRKFIRRHRALVAVATLAVLAMVGGTIGTTVGMVRAKKEAERANQEAKVANDVSQFMMELFKVSDPSEARGNTITAREILDKGAERIERDLAGQPLVQARLMFTMGNVYGELGLYEPAQRLLERALKLRRAELGNQSEDVATSLNDLADLLQTKGDYKGAEPLLREALATRRLLFGETDPRVAQTLQNLSMALWEKGDRYEGEKMIRQALPLFRGCNKGSAETVEDLAACLTNLGTMLREKGDYDEAERLYREALAMLRKLHGNEHPRVVPVLLNLARLMEVKGDLEVAESLYREAVAMQRKILGNDHPGLAVSLNNLAVALAKKGDYEGAEPIYRKALEIWRKKFGEEDPRTISATVRLAQTLRELRKYDEAEALLQEALAVQQRRNGAEHPEVAKCLQELANLALDRGRPAEAEKLAARAVSIFRKALPKGDPRTAEAEIVLASTCIALGRYAEAESLILADLPILQENTGKGSRKTQRALKAAVKLYEAWGKRAEAARYSDLLKAGGG